MRLRVLSPSRPVCDFGTNGALLTVNGLTIDTAEYYARGERVIELRSGGDGAAVVGGDGAYLATVEIPQRRYEGEENSILTPLDPNAVLVNIWPSA